MVWNPEKCLFKSYFYLSTGEGPAAEAAVPWMTTRGLCQWWVSDARSEHVYMFTWYKFWLWSLLVISLKMMTVCWCMMGNTCTTWQTCPPCSFSTSTCSWVSRHCFRTARLRPAGRQPGHPAPTASGLSPELCPHSHAWCPPPDRQTPLPVWMAVLPHEL